MIYFPITCNILTPGHIKCLHFLNKKDEVVIGLLTSKALKGYKRELMPYKDREYILLHLGLGLVVPQDSLNPTENILKFSCHSIASGDGFNKGELEAIKSLKIKKINIKLKGEKKKKYSSSKIIN